MHAEASLLSSRQPPGEGSPGPGSLEALAPPAID